MLVSLSIKITLLETSYLYNRYFLIPYPKRTITYLTRIKRQPPLLRLKAYFAPLRKIKHIPRHGMHLLARLVRDREVPFQDDLHLVVRVRVIEGHARFEAVDAARDRGFGRDFVTGGTLVLVWVARYNWDRDLERGGEDRDGGGMPGVNVAEEGVAVGNQRRVEGRLGLGVMPERGRLGRHLQRGGGGRVSETANVGTHGKIEQSCKSICWSYKFFDWKSSKPTYIEQRGSGSPCGVFHGDEFQDGHAVHSRGEVSRRDRKTSKRLRCCPIGLRHPQVASPLGYSSDDHGRNESKNRYGNIVCLQCSVGSNVTQSIADDFRNHIDAKAQDIRHDGKQ